MHRSQHSKGSPKSVSKSLISRKWNTFKEVAQSEIDEEELKDDFQPLQQVDLNEGSMNPFQNIGQQRVLLRKESIMSQAGSRPDRQYSSEDLGNDINPIQTVHNEVADDQVLITKRKIDRLKTIPHREENTKAAIDPLRFVILPRNGLKMCWDFFQMLVLIYSGIFTPYKISFINDGDFPSWDTLDNSINYFFMADIVVNFFTAYYNEETQLITSNKEIALNYLKGWFTFDLISSFPFQLIIDSSSSRYNTITRISKVPKLYRLVRIIKLARIIKFAGLQTVKIIHISTALERIIISFMMLTFSCHIVSCLWFLIASIVASDPWYLQYQDNTAYEQYTVSVYWTIQTVFTVGYGDMTIKTWQSRLFSTLWMILSVYIFSFTVGSFASYLDQIDQANQKYMKRLATLKNIQGEFGISQQLFNKIKKELTNDKTCQQSHNQLLEELPNNLRIELGLIMHKHLTIEIDLFSNRNANFISAIGPLLISLKVSANEHLFMTGDTAEEIYFIKSGKVAAILPQFNNFKFMLVKSGSYFGEIDLLFYGELRKYTFLTTKESEFYVLQKKHFRQIFMNNFRDIGFEIITKAQLKKEQLKVAYQEAVEFCEKIEEEENSSKKLRKNQKYQTQRFQRSINSISSRSQNDQLSDSTSKQNNRFEHPIQEVNEDEEQEQDTTNMMKFMDRESYIKKIQTLEKELASKDQMIQQIQQELDELVQQLQLGQTSEDSLIF